MLDIFVLPVGMQHSNYKATIKSFEKLPFSVNIYKVQNLTEVVNYKRLSKYYSFFFDVEKMDEGLRKNLKAFLVAEKWDVLVLYKKNSRTGYAEFRPRIFKHHIQLSPVTMIPLISFGLETESILNGWVLEHGYESSHKVPNGRLYEVAKSNFKFSNSGND